MRKRFVDYNAVRWLGCATRSLGAFCLALVLLTGIAHAQTRTLKLYNTHTKERVSITFKKNGRYIPGGLREANRFLRDWRRNEITKIDPKLLDLIWEVYREVRAKDYIYVVSSYRSPATNNMLRKRSRGVARNSQHTLGKAMDFYIPGVNLAKLRATGLRKQVGGVGYYPRSGSPFVHMDTGSVRHWPKMSRSQLAKVFPNGKTLHIPSDGKPMSGYKQALAEAKSGKKRQNSRPTLVASSRSEERSRTPRPQTASRAPRESAEPSDSKTTNTGNGNIFATLFGGNRENASAPQSKPGAVTAPPQDTQVASASPVIENPPVPARKARVQTPELPAQDPIVVASATPADLRTAEVDPAPTPVAPPANTLDAQRFAIETGQTPSTASVPLEQRFEVAAAPVQKPDANLNEAVQIAAAQQQLRQQVANVPVPARAPSPVTDPVAAIAAATGTSVPSPVPTPRPGTTLAYASAGVPQSAPRSLASATGQPAQTGTIGRNASALNAAVNQTRPSLRIPKHEIVDPFSGFASLPDKSETTLLSGRETTRHQTFASLSHPNQVQLQNVMIPGNRFVAAGFESQAYGNLKTDRFEGQAIMVLPVAFAR